MMLLVNTLQTELQNTTNSEILEFSLLLAICRLLVRMFVIRSSTTLDDTQTPTLAVALVHQL